MASCSISNSDELEILKQSSLNKSAYKDFMDLFKRESIIPLQRGGCVVNTKIGPIQFGIPPETVKDHMVNGFEVPTYFILPTNRFDRKLGINVAEFEFPAYYNFFLKQKQINLICTKEAEEAIRVVFQETLIGPKEHPNLEEEFYHTYDKSAIPNFPKERSFFAKHPKNPADLITIDHLINFTLFDEKGHATIDEDVSVQKVDGAFKIFEGSTELAHIKDEVSVQYSEADTVSSSKNMLTGKKTIKPFDPPYFGVTTLGNSHGFDPRGSTSGYIIWINGRGIMLDPPPFVQSILKANAIPPSIIESIIISHCHADHDAGCFQKILESQKVELITTKTIMNSFTRKYSALTGMEPDLLKKLYKFRPVIIGAPMIIHGAQFRFFYSLHTIPCIGFEVYYNDQSIYFSGDTFYHPEKIFEIKSMGLISQKRYEMLANIKWNYSLIIHEAGIPPIHTPVPVLAALPKNVKERIILVHIAQKDVPSDCGLRTAKIGFENTIALKVKPHQNLQIYKKIDLLSQIDVFDSISLKSARDLIQTSTEEHYLSGQIIVKEGTFGTKFYIIEKGICRIYSEKKDSKFERFAVAGDYFGEVALIGQRRGATVEALTDVTLFVVEKHDLQFVLGDQEGFESPGLKKLFNLSETRKSKAFATIQKNTQLSNLTLAQKTQLEMILTVKNVSEQESLWKAGEDPKFAFVIIKGIFKFIGTKEATDNPNGFDNGSFLGEVSAMLNNQPATTSVVAMTEGSIYMIKKEDLLNFLDKNPGLLVLFRDSKYFD